MTEWKLFLIRARNGRSDKSTAFRTWFLFRSIGREDVHIRAPPECAPVCPAHRWPASSKEFRRAEHSRSDTIDQGHRWSSDLPVLGRSRPETKVKVNSTCKENDENDWDEPFERIDGGTCRARNRRNVIDDTCSERCCRACDCCCSACRPAQNCTCSECALWSLQRCRRKSKRQKTNAKFSVEIGIDWMRKEKKMEKEKREYLVTRTNKSRHTTSVFMAGAERWTILFNIERFRRWFASIRVAISRATQSKMRVRSCKAFFQMCTKRKERWSMASGWFVWLWLAWTWFQGQIASIRRASDRTAKRKKINLVREKTVGRCRKRNTSTFGIVGNTKHGR